MKIFYGTDDYCIDILEVCLSKLKIDNIITIPSNDCERAEYFTDPLVNVLKKVYVIINKNKYVYEHYYKVRINILNNTIITVNENNIDKILKIKHSQLKIDYGKLKDELPEQKMAVKYLSSNNKVLEIGGNIGRNSLIIASILKSDNFVVLESDKDIYNKLKNNRDKNDFKFNIENSALSKRKLIQKNWETVESNVLKKGYKWVNILTLKELNDKYKIKFDTLVLDCEGAFYYILMDMPEILNNINLIIMENDYYNIEHKNYIDNILINNNFKRDYVKGGGWGPCESNFFEVWIK